MSETLTPEKEKERRGIKSELNNLVMHNAYQAHDWHYCIDDYKYPEYKNQWSPCPKCGLKPKVWVFDNGRSTSCGCWKSKYDHFSIYAESIMSVHKRTYGKKMTDYDIVELHINWNHWCETGEVLFKHAGERNDGRW